MSAVATEERPEVSEALDREILEQGRRLAARTRRGNVSQVAQDRALAPLLNDTQVRDALFRLVDVAPVCANAAELAEHCSALLGVVDPPRRGLGLVRGAGNRRLSREMLGRLIHLGVRRTARRFIIAESIEAAAPVVGRLWNRGVAVSVDLLGEATVSHPEADSYAQRCDEALVALTRASKVWPKQSLLERDSAGSLPRVNLSVKVTALTPLVRPEAPRRAAEDLASRLRPLLRRARGVEAHLHIDMESVDSRELTLEVVLGLLAEPEFSDGPSAGLVVQAYLRDSEEMVDLVLERTAAMSRSTPLAIRLVKGAYWDHETIQAVQNGWGPPVWSHKYESDRCFERLTRSLVDAFPAVRPAIASHNLRSVAHAITYARHRGLGDADLEIQVLRGLGTDLQDAAVAEGLRVRTYCPVGDMVAGMGYLVRRLLENSSNDSFLASRTNGVAVEDLLRRP